MQSRIQVVQNNRQMQKMLSAQTNKKNTNTKKPKANKAPKPKKS